MSSEDSSNTNRAASVNRPERRAPRYEFVATVELKDSATSTRLAGRVAEISRHGCYVDTLNSFPQGSPVGLLISRGESKFETDGKVIYVIPNLGMGIAFADLAADQLPVLEAWLAELTPL